ncbi:hypothetical protein ACQKWADRAFT_236436 [Trichoderma austrokoningii]
MMNWIQVAVFLLAASVDALDSHAAICRPDYNGKFEVTIHKLGKRDLGKRSCGNSEALLLTLQDGILKDAKDRTGYIASNNQFQFDDPPQVNAIYTKNFSACENDTLALRGSTTFYQCRSGNFYNLYDRNWAPQCEPIEILIIPCDGYNGHGETTVSSKVVQTAIVTAIKDGQPQVHTTTLAVPICQIGDGQVQGHTTVCGGGSPASSPISQISDGQIVHPVSPTGPAGPPVTQLPDGQPQGPGSKILPTGTGSIPKLPPSTSEVPVNGAAQLFGNVKAATVVVVAYMLMGI